MAEQDEEKVDIRPCCGGHEVCFDHCVREEAKYGGFQDEPPYDPFGPIDFGDDED